MAGEWKRYKVGDLFDLVPGFAFKSDDFNESGVPVIKIKNVKANALVLNDLSYVDPRFLERRKDNIIKFGDILITMSGNRFGGSKDTWVGKVAQFRNSGLFLLNQRVGILRPKRMVEVDTRCCAYFLGSDDYQNLFISIATSSGGQANLSPNQILEADILLPLIKEQRAIAHILGTLDDKIELNRKMNETLEQMARALFKSWFIDFEPVRAKMEGRWKKGQSLPGLPAHLYDLFPDRLVRTEFGEIPKGWRVGTLTELSHKPQYGFTASAKDEPIGPKFLRITDINKLPWIDWSKVPYCEIPKEDLESYRLNKGDVLIARMADPGHGIVVEDQVEAVFASYLIRFKIQDPAYTRYIQYWLRSDVYWDLVKARCAGTTRASLNARILGAFRLFIPPRSVVLEFSQIIDIIRNKIIANVSESNTLEQIRDTLLPKLIHGEISLANFEGGKYE